MPSRQAGSKQSHSAAGKHAANGAAPPAGAQPAAKPWEHAKAGEGSASDPLAMRFVESLSYDVRLYDADIRGSLAHAAMLERVGLITRSDLEAIQQGLTEIKAEIESANIVGWSGWKVELEDVHMCIEAALIAKVGDSGRKLHTGRSRNDQVALDLRLWLRDAAAEAENAIRRVGQSMRELAARQGDVILPGYTHMQRAQPITVGAELAAWCAMLGRDAVLLANCAADGHDCPIGSGALAGSSLALDRDAVASALGFSGPSPSSIDSTTSRDEALDFVYALARTAMHLSRWAEQWILYCTTEFGFLKLDERFTTGSSMMPQKRNPDMLELIRGRCGGIYGHLNALLIICKGLPLGYNRDLQEDKRHIFAAFDTVMDCLEMAARIAETASFVPDKILSAGGGLERGYLDATALAEHLVTAGVPFRTAHQVVGSLVQLCDQTGRTSLRELTTQELAEAVRSRGVNNITIDAAGIIASLGVANVARSYRTRGHAGTGIGGYRQILLNSPIAPASKPSVAPTPPAARTRELAPPPSTAQPTAAAARPKMPVLKAGRPVNAAGAAIAPSPVTEPIGPLTHGAPPPSSSRVVDDKPATLFIADEPAEASGGGVEGSTGSQFNQRLIAAYVEVGRTLDDLPYTEEFLRLCHLSAAAEAGMNEQAVFRRLQNIRKAGKLPPIGRAPSKAQRINAEEEEWLRENVTIAVGSLGQRDQLPFSPKFDLLLQRFNDVTGRSLDPHDLWRVIAKIAK